MLLSDLKVGQTGLIKSINLDKDEKERLVDMGLVCGTEVTLKYKAPLGDPLWFEVRGYNLVFRKNSAKKIQIELANCKRKRKN